MPGSFSHPEVSRPRFFVDAPLAVGESIRLPADVAHHAARVLRLRDGAPIVLFDGRGGEYPAALRVRGAAALAQVEAFDPTERESPLRLTLVQALVAADKLDWIVEKAAELVVDNIKHEDEVDCLKQAGVTVYRLKDILSEMAEKPVVVKAAAGADLFDLMLLRG